MWVTGQRVHITSVIKSQIRVIHLTGSSELRRLSTALEFLIAFDSHPYLRAGPSISLVVIYTLWQALRRLI